MSVPLRRLYWCNSYRLLAIGHRPDCLPEHARRRRCSQICRQEFRLGVLSFNSRFHRYLQGKTLKTAISYQPGTERRGNGMKLYGRVTATHAVKAEDLQKLQALLDLAHTARQWNLFAIFQRHDMFPSQRRLQSRHTGQIDNERPVDAQKMLWRQAGLQIG